MSNKTTYVKLGDKAQSFSCPTTGIKLLPGRVIAITAKQAQSKKIIMALKGGHLERATAEEFEGTISVENSNDSDGIYIEADLKGLTKDSLLAIAAGIEGSDEDELSSMKKAELVDYILENQEAQ